MILIREGWPGKIITSRLLLEMAARVACEKQKQYVKQLGGVLCNDIQAYTQAFCEAFADGYQSMTIALQNDESKYENYMHTFGHMSVAEACKLILTYPKEKQGASHV